MLGTLAPFQGLRIEPAYNWSTKVFREVLEINPSVLTALFVNLPKPKVGKLIRIKGERDWRLSYENDKFIGLYLPARGITGHEPVVKNHINRAWLNQHVVSVRPLLWEDWPARRKRQLNEAEVQTLTRLTLRR